MSKVKQIEEAIVASNMINLIKILLDNIRDKGDRFNTSSLLKGVLDSLSLTTNGHGEYWVQLCRLVSLVVSTFDKLPSLHKNQLEDIYEVIRYFLCKESLTDDEFYNKVEFLKSLNFKNLIIINSI